MKYEMTIPGLKLKSLGNSRMHWAVRHAYNRKVREAIVGESLVAGLGGVTPLERAYVVVTRTGPKLLDKDNLYSSIKPVVDALKAIRHSKAWNMDQWTRWGLIWDDDPAHCEIVARQEKGPYAVRIEVTER